MIENNIVDLIVKSIGIFKQKIKIDLKRRKIPLENLTIEKVN